MVTRILTKLAIGCVGAAVLGVGGASSARAADIDYISLFRTKAIKCIHSTVNPDKATIEILKPAETAGEVTTVRLKVYYDGLIKKNTLESELMIRQAGSIRQLKIHILADTGTQVGTCALEKNWADF